MNSRTLAFNNMGLDPKNSANGPLRVWSFMLTFAFRNNSIGAFAPSPILLSMQIDILWLRKWFDTFNQQYFDGGLPTPRFHIGHSRTQLGTLSYKRKRGLMRTSLYDFALGMSNYYDQSEHQFQSVLLHEMIHLSIAASGLTDTAPHGVVFRGMMSRLNREGWHIQVATSTRGMQKAFTGSERVIGQYLVLAIELADGRHFLSSVSPRHARALNERVRQASEVRQAAWYTTSDPWFADMPKVRSLRGRHVSAEVFANKTARMKPIAF